MVIYENLQRINNNMLKLMEYTSQLLGERSIFNDINERLFKLMRKVVIANELSNRSVICISGLQGAGKTTLIESFYKIDSSYMNVTLGRGERIPILITEKKDCTAPYAVHVYLEKQCDKIIRRENVIHSDEFRKLSSGCESGGNTMYLELFVPMRHTYDERVSFMLLPGYERKNDYWRTLIDFSVYCSDTAVFVFDKTSFTLKENHDLCVRMQEDFGANFIYAISRSDTSADSNEETKKNCMKVMRVPEYESDRIVCVGKYNDASKQLEWINELKSSIQKYANSSKMFNDKSKKYICDLIENEIRIILYEIREAVGTDDGNEILVELENSSHLKTFDAKKSRFRRTLSDTLDDKLESAKKKAEENLYKIMDDPVEAKKHNVKISNWDRSRRKIFGNSLKDINNGNKIVDAAMKNDDGESYLFQDAFRDAVISTTNTLMRNNKTRDLLTKADTSTYIKCILDKNSYFPAALGEKRIKSDICDDILHDVLTLLSPKKNKHPILRHDDIRETLEVMVEAGSAYFAIVSIGESKVDIEGFEFAESGLNSEKIKESMSETAKFSCALLGMVGIDFLPDGVINGFPTLAESLGPAGIPVASAVGAIMALGLVSAIIRDINHMQITDYESARGSIASVFSSVRVKYLKAYDDCMLEIRRTLEENLIAFKNINKNAALKFNIMSMLNMLDSDFREIGYDIIKDKYDITTAFN